jgi:hypothetical protein
LALVVAFSVRGIYGTVVVALVLLGLEGVYQVLRRQNR